MALSSMYRQGRQVVVPPQVHNTESSRGGNVDGTSADSVRSRHFISPASLGESRDAGHLCKSLHVEDTAVSAPEMWAKGMPFNSRFGYAELMKAVRQDQLKKQRLVWRNLPYLLQFTSLGRLFRAGALYAKPDGSKGGKDRGKANGGSDNDGSNGGGGDGEDNVGDSGAPNASPWASVDEWLIPRTTLFVFVMFLLSGGLYYLSLPAGHHTGWSSLQKHASDITAIYLYQNYAQIYTEQSGSWYVGLVDDQHTNEKMQELERARRKSKAASPDTKGKAEGEATLVENAQDLDVHFLGTPLGESALAALGMVAWMVPFIFFPIFVMILSNSIGTSMMAVMDAGKKSNKVKDMMFRVETTSNTRFHDVAGMKEAKKEITEIVDFLKRPQVYTALGAKIPTGALLLGPPGTGKTLLAKAVAGESGVGFIPVTGSDFVELYVGMGALRVRQLFELAKKQRCIIYIDEIDAIGLKRRGAGHGEKQEQEHTLNELLTQLDGFGTGNRGDVMILASSNVAQDQLDPALIRPGRFDRLVHVDAPVIGERIDIFKVHLSKIKLVATEEEKKVIAEAAAETESAAKESSAAAPGESTATSPDHEARSAGEKAEENPKQPQRASAESKVDRVHAEIESAGSSLVISSLVQDREADDALRNDSDKRGEQHTDAFDFRALLLNKSEEERALINAYADRMSRLCPGFVGADISNVCNEGAILAAREGSISVNITHLEKSIDRVLAGIEQRSRVLTQFEKEVVAHHEAGHAIAGWFLNRADPLMKVSIIPRGGSALGYAQYLPSENRMQTANEILDSICVTLGGRVAEKIFFNHLSTGASDDLRKVTRMAYTYVSAYQKVLVHPAPGSQGTRLVKPFGPKTSDALDEAAKKLVDDMYQRTYDLLMDKKVHMETLAKHLLEKEMLTYQDVVDYLGKREERESDVRRGV